MWADYFLFLMKALTFLFVIGFLILIIAKAAKGDRSEGGHLKITKVNDSLQQLKQGLQQQTLDKKAFKAEMKAKKLADKAKKSEHSPKSWVLKFAGDMQASQVQSLRREITALLTVAKENDEVVLLLESPGGAVSGYGLAASQLQRIKDAGLKLTVCVDKVAASGGYMMACIADRILAAPFAIVGSIGVLSQIPNVHGLLKKHDIEVDVLTAGKHKAPMTLLGKNTDEGREKHRQDLEQIHVQFKALVQKFRPSLDIEKVADGSYWLAIDALNYNLVDELKTSDDYLQTIESERDIYQVSWQRPKTLEQRLKGGSQAVIEQLEHWIFSRRLP